MRFILIIILFLSTNSIFGQQDAENIVRGYLDTNFIELGLNRDDISEVFITDEYTSVKSGVYHIYFKQAFGGIQLESTNSALHLKDNEVISFNQGFIKNHSDKINASEASLSHEDAFLSAMIHLGNNETGTLRLLEQNSDRPDKFRRYDQNEVSHDAFTIKLVYLPSGKNILLSYEIAVHDRATNKWWQIFVDAITGEVLEKVCWTLECHSNHDEDLNHKNPEIWTKNIWSVVKSGLANSPAMASSYNVLSFPFMSPLDGTRTLESDPWNAASNASPYGWHDTDGSAGNEFTITRGNNVHAQEDRNGDNGTGYSPDGGTGLVFDYTFDEHDDPVDYQDAAITNLFYWNNIMHDVWYQYGFDESAGNFQSNNYGNGGSGNDYVLADAQDGSGNNNANFSTPPDGSKPRMQMFEWSSATYNLVNINSPVNLERYYGCGGADFGPADNTITGNLVLATPLDGCNTLTNPGAINGNIALIDRGSCNFTVKVKNAQDAGAVAAVICQNTVDPPFTMGGTDASITIPSIMISKLNCDSIKAYLPGVNITLDRNSPVLKDSDFENGVIIHEYGHGISIRLTGGPASSSCLNNDEQMGEGWSDWFGLVMTMQDSDIGLSTRGMGSYLLGEALNDDGIRQHPYTTDLNVNPHTYGDISAVSIPHGVGSVWSAMLWEMTWALIDQYGWDSNLYSGTGGNNMAMELVIEALKLQPCSPGFIDGRDAILQADQNLNGGANECLIWEAFAKRGLGFSASQGSSASVNDGIEAFDTPPSCLDTIVITKTAGSIIESGTDLSYVLTVSNYYDTDLTNVIIKDTLPLNTSLVPGSLSCGTINNNIITINVGTLNVDSTVTCDYAIETDNIENSMISFFDGVENGTTNWTISSGQGTDIFTTSTANPFNGTSTSWFVPNVGPNNSQYLTSSLIQLGVDPVLTFWHDYDTEANWDGGMVEISTDGSSWTDLGPSFFVNGYNGVLGNSSNNDIDNRPAFTGDSNGYIESFADLGNYANSTVYIRFFFGSDNNTFETGWYIDNISVLDANYLSNTAYVTSAQGDLAFSSATTLVRIDCNTPMTVYQDFDMDSFGDASVYQTTCSIPPGYVGNFLDCDDNDSSINPAAAELCDGIDNNCNAHIDEGCSVIECEGDSLTINTISMDEYNAKDYINSDATIITGQDILFTAGDEMELLSGFEVETGSVFEALIEDCTTVLKIQIDQNPNAVMKEGPRKDKMR
ncbi:MAG: T9SS-dependent M36 family metallopeptidase [Bacteroidia bacterium]|nr:T9SS-dependent M36 family metallopeptidase [Bacteroidia bacterium]